MADQHPPSKPDRADLFATASEQHGFFTTSQAARAGFSRRMLTHYARSGEFIRERRSVYRFRDYPSSPWAHIQAACLATGPADAVVSHESALELLGLSDVVPRTVHLTVPRHRRSRQAPPGATIHTARHPPAPAEVVERDGFRMTAPARSIVAAIVDALERGMATAEDLRTAARRRGRRVVDLVDLGIAEVETR